MKSMKHALATVIASAVGMSAFSAEVTGEEAAQAARSWLDSSCAFGIPAKTSLGGVETLTVTNDITVHIVSLAGGGYVVTSSDTEREPILAYSRNGTFAAGNPLVAMMARAFAAEADAAPKPGRRLGTSSASSAQAAKFEERAERARAKWERLLVDTSFISDLRVAPFLKTKWSQTEVAGEPCFNYYTPSNYPCGCVAAAGIQMMRHFEWPNVAMAQFTNGNCAIRDAQDAASRPLTLQSFGGTYDWASMPEEPDDTITEVERQAIGKLAYDMAVGCSTTFTKSGSESVGIRLAPVLCERFGYSNAIAYQSVGGSVNMPTNDLYSAILPNLDAGIPVALCIRNDSDGHLVVGDGYGYAEGTLYCHLNLGWQGMDDAWYALPTISTVNGDFTVVDGMVYNVFTNGNAGASIYSGRVLDNMNHPMAGVEVKAQRSGSTPVTTMTDANGVYALILLPGTYTFSAAYGSLSGVATVINVGTCVGTVTTEDLHWHTDPVPVVANSYGHDVTLDVTGTVNPTISPGSCLFYPTTNVTITCATSGVTIRYTLDGTDPDETSAVYSGPITIPSRDTTLKARAFGNSGRYPSAIVTATYTYALEGDYYDSPVAIVGDEGAWSTDSFKAYTIETDEPYHTLTNNGYKFQFGSAWFKWKAPGSGTVTFSSHSAGPKIGDTQSIYYWPTYIALYEHCDDIGDLKRLDMSTNCVEHADYTTTLTFNAQEGVTYMIAIVRGNDEMEACDLAVTWSVPSPMVVEDPSVLVATPTFDPPSCTFYPSTNVTISCATSEAAIRYTTDGSTPDETSELYTGPIVVSHDMTIRARAFKGGLEQSMTAEATYVYDTSVTGPRGDAFEVPIVISGESGLVTIPDTSDYTVEPGEPYHTVYYQARTVWYEWTAPGSGSVTFSTYGHTSTIYFQTLIAAYTNTWNKSDRIGYCVTCAADAPYETSLTFNVREGVTYRIVGMVPLYGAGGESEFSYSGTFYCSWTSELTVDAPPTITTFSPGGTIDTDEAVHCTLTQGTSETFVVVASDAEGDPLTYAWTLDGDRQASTSNYMQFTRATSDAETHEIVCTVSDGLKSTSKRWIVASKSAWPEIAVPEGATPAQKQAAVSNALVSVGFSAGVAARVKTTTAYSNLTTWAQSNGVPPSTCAASGTALLSAAIGADALVEVSPQDLAPSQFTVSPGQSARILLPIEGYDVSKVNSELLSSAVEVVGTASLGSEFTTQGLGSAVVPQNDGVEITVTPPSGANGYFMKVKVY